jgi:uncharacterized BrkB/YihY/UPF0761 family membrane protein
MKSLEKLAIVAIILYFVSTVISRVGNILMTLPTFGCSATNTALLAIPYVVILLAVNIAIAIWLYRIAKHEQEKPWVWALFGFVFGVSGAILYFVFRIYEMIKLKEKK